MSAASPPTERTGAARESAPAPIWQSASLRLAVALAFADASIVVLALPQIVDRLHTPISHVTWVIIAYNLALVASSAVVIVLRGRIDARRTLIAGLAVFGLASIGCGASDSLAALVPLRCLQGGGGALVLCASLPLFTAVPGRVRSPLHSWSAAAAIGAALGPAAGGVLTQVFDWRSIFFAQAPVAALAAAAVLLTTSAPETELTQTPTPTRRPLDSLSANAALTFLSAGLIGALFLVVIELINAWLLTPIAAAAVVTTIPLATALTERLARGRSPTLLGAGGSVLLALGLLTLALLSYRQLGLVVLGLALCGAGLGLGFPGLSAAALRGGGPAAVRAARTVAARDAGLVIGLLILTPVFVNQVNAAPSQATPALAGQLFVAPIPTSLKLSLVPELERAASRAPDSSPPNIAPVFDRARAGRPAPVKAQLTSLQVQMVAVINDAVTHAFKRPFLVAGGLALLVLPLLGLRLVYARRRGQLSG